MSRQAGRFVDLVLTLEHCSYASMLNWQMLTTADFEIQPRNLARAIRPCSLQRSAPNSGDLLSAAPFGVLILYPIPEPGNGPAPKNFFRHFLGRLHRPQDFQFLVDGMTRILNQPVRLVSSPFYAYSHVPAASKHIIPTWQSEVTDLGT
jgi:hypothetical protein